LGVDALWLKKSRRLIQVADNAVLRQQPAGGGHVGDHVGADGHGHLHKRLLPLGLDGQLHHHLVEHAGAQLLQAAAGRLEVGLDQAGLFEDVDVLGGGGLG
jgi:hypothetical protein